MVLSNTSRWLPCLIVATLMMPSGRLCAEANLPEVSRQAPDRLTFEQHVRPILKTHCFHCHGEESEIEGSLDLRLRRTILAGGESGPAVVPERSRQSVLWQRLERREMPPGNKRVPDDQLQVIRKWIDQGAVTAMDEPEVAAPAAITEDEKKFWSFQPVHAPTLPAVEHADQVESPIDAFVWARLEAQGLPMSPPAESRTLLRRVFFDLLGLPPTPDDVRAFDNDRSIEAYERLVDRLLASPQFGERWGRHWLDTAGYADSEGFTDADPVRDFAYYYRDYVIRSFNSDKPYDQFVTEQLAGDELASSPESPKTPADVERIAATGFLRMAPDGSATDSIDLAVASNEMIADTIQIVSTSLLGLTVGCARCHNHRYDPITQVDYYRIRAVFEPALDWKHWKRPNDRRVSLDTEADRAVREQVEAQAIQVEADMAQRQEEHIQRTLEEELYVAPDEHRDALRAAYRTVQSERSAEQVALLETYPNIGNISSGSLYLYAEQRTRRAQGIASAADDRESRYLTAVRDAYRAAVLPDMLATLDEILAVPADQRTEMQQAIAAKYPGVFVTADTLHQFDEAGAKEVAQYRDASARCRELDAKTELAEMRQEAARIRAAAPSERFLRVLTEPDPRTPDYHLPVTYLFHRGDHQQPGQPVTPGDLEVVSGVGPAEIPLVEPQRATTGRRLAYARHLTNGNHPLFARVIVNRVWMHLFGQGIVATSGDFGTLGARPTHPELLDWLAHRLVQDRWQLKSLIREIVTSRTYRQASRATGMTAEGEGSRQVDPDNRWLGRMSMRRLEAEVLRDSILAVSGQLVSEMYGPPVPVKEDAVGQIVIGRESLDGERKPTDADELGRDAHRRSLYVQVRRSRPLAVLESFDLATVAPNCSQRSSSNVAPQALLLMNSEFVWQYATRMAEDLERHAANARDQSQLAWQRCYGQPPDDDAMAMMAEFLAVQQKAFESRRSAGSVAEIERLALASLCQTLLSSNEFLYID